MFSLDYLGLQIIRDTPLNEQLEHKLRVQEITKPFDARMSPDELAKRLSTRQRYAASLLSLLSTHNWVLVSLLCLNTLALEAFPILLDQLVPSVAAVLLAACLVLVFGDIIPEVDMVRQQPTPSPRAVLVGFRPISLGFRFNSVVRCIRSCARLRYRCATHTAVLHSGVFAGCDFSGELAAGEDVGLVGGLRERYQFANPECDAC
jgi:hypothetical protein